MVYHAVCLKSAFSAPMYASIAKIEFCVKFFIQVFLEAVKNKLNFQRVCQIYFKNNFQRVKKYCKILMQF